MVNMRLYRGWYLWYYSQLLRADKWPVALDEVSWDSDDALSVTVAI